MSKKYKNPPVIEAVCEIRFSEDSKWDFTVPGLLFEKVKDEFPSKSKAALSFLDRPLAELAVFTTPNKNTSIRVGTQYPILSILKQKPYGSWNEFKPQIEKTYTELKTIDGVDIKGIQRIGLRYVNLIEIPHESVTLGNYFEFAPSLGKRLPRELRTFLLGTEFNFFDERDVCRVQLASALPGPAGQYRANLDLDYYLAKSQAVSPDDVIEWVENAHTNLEVLFEGCITEKARELFGEIR